jgi:ferrous iron transport protein B
MDMGLKLVMSLNMFDELKSSGSQLDHKELSKRTGFPIIPTVSSKGEGIDALFQQIIHTYEEKEMDISSIKYSTAIEESIAAVEHDLLDTSAGINGYQHLSSRFTALKLVEKDEEFSAYAQSNFGEKILSSIADQVQALEKQYENSSASIVTGVRYSVINELLEGVLQVVESPTDSIKDKVDTLLTHRLWGFPIFLGFMWIMFQATFKVGQYPMDWIEMGVGALGDFISNGMSAGPLRGLLVDGVIGGVGGVIVFLPNILILFLFISLMEDTGYMARAVFIMDKLMHKIGLHGKSFIPLVMGFGCNVPAIMATRTLGNKNDRLLTMLVNPFMSCSARLPVYILVIGAFFPNNPGTMLFLMYFIGIALAILFALLFKKLLFKTTYTAFVMELPPFRIPTLKTSIKHMWHKGSQYLKKMGGVILVASIIIWAMGYYPREAVYSQDFDAQITQSQEVDAVAQLEFLKEGERFEQSYIGRMGQFIEPVISPLGFDWKMGVSLLTGFAAKEIVVSTMGVLYQAEPDADETSSNLMSKLQNHRLTRGPRKGEIAYTPLVAFSFMLFVLIYFPCVSTIAAINSESGSKRWAIFSMVYPTVLAWVLSFIVFQLGSIWAV